jgi:channel protein (hemolysin III family)
MLTNCKLCNVIKPTNPDKGTTMGNGVNQFSITEEIWHAITHTKVKKVFQQFDHASIYFLIAGTYTDLYYLKPLGFKYHPLSTV